LAHQTSCQQSDGGSLFCRGLGPIYALITISLMTLGGTMIVLSIERNGDNAAGLSILGSLVVLIGSGLLLGFFLNLG